MIRISSFTRRQYPKCCEKAVELKQGDPHWFFCVCACLEDCPDHGIQHIGTHD
mgnify:FL=1